ncbi:SirB2 family protein [Pleionea litopenaei]|uniref:SirB2 family protein n=1 Tax=Pleionea litopenaei TaxID=3070815 RepID=A0AA51RRB1_9GAMM|nr:SirB2 family protein [Pleionea sp. HL-JVS1]WMS86098.1 SirB2 family protein [Pleionea sp. HL-JVS1]
MEIYPITKHIHMMFAGLSLLGFVIRGYWMISGSKMLNAKPVKILPHIIDTVLLISAVVLVIVTGYYPLKFDWVTLKILLLVAYIVLGTFALKRGKTKTIKIVAFVLALVTFFAIYGTVIHKPSF